MHFSYGKAISPLGRLLFCLRDIALSMLHKRSPSLSRQTVGRLSLSKPAHPAPCRGVRFFLLVLCGAFFLYPGGDACSCRRDCVAFPKGAAEGAVAISRAAGEGRRLCRRLLRVLCTLAMTSHRAPSLSRRILSFSSRPGGDACLCRCDYVSLRARSAKQPPEGGKQPPVWLVIRQDYSGDCFRRFASSQ